MVLFFLFGSIVYPFYGPTGRGGSMYFMLQTVTGRIDRVLLGCSQLELTAASYCLTTGERLDDTLDGGIVRVRMDAEAKAGHQAEHLAVGR